MNYTMPSAAATTEVFRSLSDPTRRGLFERGGTAGDPRGRIAGGALEALAGAMAAGGANLEPSAARRHRKIVAEQAAERAGHVLSHLCRRARAHGPPGAPASVLMLLSRHI